MNTILAVGIAEGYIPCETEEQQLEAWQYIVDNGMAWKLQGWFGRCALELIAAGLINPPPGFKFEGGQLHEIQDQGS